MSRRIQSRLSPKAWRLYDGRKLLTPAHIDARTGYRYYGPEELDRARRITLLRAIGMPLADIADVLGVSGPQAVSRERRVRRREARPVARGRAGRAEDGVTAALREGR
ncbi:MerR family transcriptional regulator [Micromonospora rubida]|uniref:MerR family transcriptional regulator n=1 Tax=Micromonospora rubida TaxID=2697657 RepID=UPI00137653FE|nr:MerR family transcriptional regulator [Micromonospora rubida]NBE80137.1 MerR family transcriptional regulator [Micromonospora rubida]